MILTAYFQPGSNNQAENTETAQCKNNDFFADLRGRNGFWFHPRYVIILLRSFHIFDLAYVVLIAHFSSGSLVQKKQEQTKNYDYGRFHKKKLMANNVQ